MAVRGSHTYDEQPQHRNNAPAYCSRLQMYYLSFSCHAISQSFLVGKDCVTSVKKASVESKDV